MRKKSTGRKSRDTVPLKQILAPQEVLSTRDTTVPVPMSKVKQKNILLSSVVENLENFEPDPDPTFENI
jgi:hypothetical protein